MPAALDLYEIMKLLITMTVTDHFPTSNPLKKMTYLSISHGAEYLKKIFNVN